MIFQKKSRKRREILLVVCLVVVAVAGSNFLGRIGLARSEASDMLQPKVTCTLDADCMLGMFCGQDHVCHNPFACTARPIVDVTWKNGIDLTAGGIFDGISGGEYLSLVPIRSETLWSRRWALRASGGPFNTHSAEHVLIKHFGIPLKYFSGRMRVNLFNLLDTPTCTGCFNYPLILLGGYSSPAWPAPGLWQRDLAIGSIGRLPPLKTDPHKIFGGQAFKHNVDAVSNPLLYPIGQPTQWPDRMVDLEWYVTPQGNMYMRVDGQQWVLVSQVNEQTDPRWRYLYGIALGWVSSWDGGSVDIGSLHLYPLTCQGQ